MGYLLNSEAYQIFVQLEVGVREFLIEIIGESGTKEWFVSFLGNAQRESINEVVKRVGQRISKNEVSSLEDIYIFKLKRAQKIIETNNLIAKLHHPFYYLNWTDMESLIKMKANGDLIDKKIGRANKELIASNLSALSNLRNDIAHSRFITESDFSLIQGSFVQISTVIPNFNSLCQKQSMESRTDFLLNEIYKHILLIESEVLLETEEINDILDLMRICKNSFWLNSFFPKLTDNISDFISHVNDYEIKRYQPGGLLLLQKWKKTHEVFLNEFKINTHGKI